MNTRKYWDDDIEDYVEVVELFDLDGQQYIEADMDDGEAAYFDPNDPSEEHRFRPYTLRTVAEVVYEEQYRQQGPEGGHPPVVFFYKDLDRGWIAVAFDDDEGFYR